VVAAGIATKLSRPAEPTRSGGHPLTIQTSVLAWRARSERDQSRLAKRYARLVTPVRSDACTIFEGRAQPTDRMQAWSTHKDRAARIWCENATLLTGTAWDYVKVPQGDFERLRPADLADLRLAFGGGSPWIRT